MILYFVYAASCFDYMLKDTESSIPATGDVYVNETIDEILEEYVDVSFGEFKITNNGYFDETSLDITVKNKADRRFTYYITIEAIDANGARIETDIIYAGRLASEQKIYLKAFEYIDQDKLDQFRYATLIILEINKF